jgi:DNA topoisomerase-2
MADYGCTLFEKTFKLYTTSSTTNMRLFNANDKLKKYENVEDIIDEYYETRLKMYQTRKDYMILTLEKELIILLNRTKYIKENLNDTIDLRKKKKEDVIDMLTSKGYDIIENDIEYKYLTKMPMDSVTEENAEKLFNEYNKKINEIEEIKNKTITEMWNTELNNLQHEYIIYKKDREKMNSCENIQIIPEIKKIGIKKNKCLKINV